MLLGALRCIFSKALFLCMTISFIAAVAEDHAIGRNNQLPWSLPEDLKFFKRTTMGKPVVMGRKSYESLGRPLPGRLNVILSRRPQEGLPEGVMAFSSGGEAFQWLEEQSYEEVFVIGGGEIYKQLMPQADVLYITHVETTVPGADTFFPPIDHAQWHKVWQEHHEADERHRYPFTFCKYERIAL